MANKKQKQKQKQEVKRQPSKQEKERFSMATRAHGPKGLIIDWTFLKTLWSI